MLKDIRLVLIGFGNVGRAFASLLLQKEETLLNEFGIQAHVTGIVTKRHGSALNSDGIDLAKALALIEGNHSLWS